MRRERKEAGSLNEPYGRGGTLYVRKFNLDASDYARFVCEMRHQGYVSEFAFARELILQALGACEKKRSAAAVERGNAGSSLREQ